MKAPHSGLSLQWIQTQLLGVRWLELSPKQIKSLNKSFLPFVFCFVFFSAAVSGESCEWFLRTWLSVLVFQEIWNCLCILQAVRKKAWHMGRKCKYTIAHIYWALDLICVVKILNMFSRNRLEATLAISQKTFWQLTTFILIRNMKFQLRYGNI